MPSITLHRCQNCDATLKNDEIVQDIRDLHQRVSPGEPCPSGECPHCGALCHEIDQPGDKSSEFKLLARAEVPSVQI